MVQAVANPFGGVQAVAWERARDRVGVPCRSPMGANCVVHCAVPCCARADSCCAVLALVLCLQSYAFLEMRSVEEASNAMAFDGVVFQDTNLKVCGWVCKGL